MGLIPLLLLLSLLPLDEVCGRGCRCCGSSGDDGAGVVEGCAGVEVDASVVRHSCQPVKLCGASPSQRTLQNANDIVTKIQDEVPWIFA